MGTLTTYYQIQARAFPIGSVNAPIAAHNYFALVKIDVDASGNTTQTSIQEIHGGALVDKT